MYIISPHKKHESLGVDSFFAPESMLRFINKNGKLLPEQDLINFARKELSDSTKSFVDIGAHIGSYTFELATSFNHVHSFEPAQEAYNYLCSNVILKGLTRKTTTYNVAIGSSKKKEVFCVREIDGGTSGLPLFDENNEAVVGHNESSYPVNVETLDSFKLTNVGLLKIDVEGYELDVLKGAVKTLIRNNYPSILFECNYMIGCHPDNLEETFESAQKKLFVFLADLGYSISHIKESEMYIARRSTTLQNLLECFIKNPHDNLNKFWLGYEYEKLGHCSSAMGYYLSCAENTDDDLLAYECLLRKAVAFRRIGGREAHVRNALQLAVSLLPQRPEAYYLMSVVYEITRDARDEDKWQQSYAWASIGKEIDVIFKGESLLTDVGYEGYSALEFQQAVALWWMGRFSCAKDLFNKLLENPFITERHRQAALSNLKVLSTKEKKLNT